MALIPFPDLRPTSRSYTPGEYPARSFVALNGATTILRYSNRRSNSSLDLSFENISDERAAEVLAHYEAVTRAGDWIQFTAANGLAGVSVALQPWLAEANSGLRWRFAEPPKVSSIFPGRSTVSASFTGFLDG